MRSCKVMRVSWAGVAVVWLAAVRPGWLSFSLPPSPTLWLLRRDDVRRRSMWDAHAYVQKGEALGCSVLTAASPLAFADRRAAPQEVGGRLSCFTTRNENTPMTVARRA